MTMGLFNKVSGLPQGAYGKAAGYSDADESFIGADVDGMICHMGLYPNYIKLRTREPRTEQIKRAMEDPISALVGPAQEVERIIRVGSHVRDFERWTEFGKRCYTLKIMGTRKLVRIRLVPADGQRFENYVMSHWM